MKSSIFHQTKNKNPPYLITKENSLTSLLFVPTAVSVAKIHALTEEIRELHYRKFRPFLFLLTALLSDGFILNFHKIPFVSTMRLKLYKYIIENILVNPVFQQALVNLFPSSEYFLKDLRKNSHFNRQVSSELQFYLDFFFVIIVETPFMIGFYQFGKKITKTIANYIAFNKSMPTNAKAYDNFSQQELEFSSKALLIVRNAGIHSAECTAKLCVAMFLLSFLLVSSKVPDFLYESIGALSDNQEFMGMNTDCFSYTLNWFFIFVVYAIAEVYFTKRSLSFIEKDHKEFLAQLTKITCGFNVNWETEKGGYLKSSCFILNLSTHEKIKHKEFTLNKEVFLKILKETFSISSCNVICYNAYRGIIITRDKVFSAHELTCFINKFKASLILVANKESHIEKSLAQLNHSAHFFDPHYSWGYYPDNNAFALNLAEKDKGEREQLTQCITTLFGNNRVYFNQESGCLLVSGIDPAMVSDYSHMVNRLMRQPCKTSDVTYSGDIGKSMVAPQKPAKIKTRPVNEFLITTEEAAAEDLKEPDGNDFSKKLYPIYSPNFLIGSHFSRYSVQNKGIMAMTDRGSIAYERFFEVIKRGQMGGRGNRIVHLKSPRFVKGIFGDSIKATHKLVIPSEDMRIYGVKKTEHTKNIIDFTTVVPRHKWVNR